MTELKATVLSLGAGVQSSALLLMSDRGEVERADFAVFADTGAEPPHVYEWLDKLERSVSIPIIRATAGNIVEDILNPARRRFAAVPFFTMNPDGSKGMGRRQCTREYKIDVIKRTIRNRPGYLPRQRMKHHVRVMIGISIDEIQRMKPSRIKWQTSFWPLIDLGLRRQQCVEYVEKSGLGTPPRSACYMCPFRSDKEWIAMRRDDPETFAKACDFDRQLRDDQSSIARKMKSQNFVHRSLAPLGEVRFKGENQPDLFTNECEGICGV